MKILVVDDNQTVAFTTEAILAHENHHVKTANNGDDGYSAYLHFEPEVVITDIQMPHKNGFQMMETIRSHNPEVKAIYMSGNLNLFHSELEMEKNRYAAIPLSKPFTRMDLLSALHTVCKTVRLDGLTSASFNSSCFSKTHLITHQQN